MFGIIGRTGSGMRQVVGFGFGIGPREWVLFGANLGHAIVTNGDFTAYVCDSAATRPSSQITIKLFLFRFYLAFTIYVARLSSRAHVEKSQ